jgi:hypothetical protein
MTRSRGIPVPASAGLASDLCWICWRQLEDYTDGEGRVYRGCPPCRAEIERLQALDQRRRRFEVMRVGAMRGAPKAVAPSRPTWPRCGKAELRHARAVARREGLVAAAKATGLNYHTLYAHAKREGWALGRGKGR